MSTNKGHGEVGRRRGQRLRRLAHRHRRRQRSEVAAGTGPGAGGGRRRRQVARAVRGSSILVCTRRDVAPSAFRSRCRSAARARWPKFSRNRTNSPPTQAEFGRPRANLVDSGPKLSNTGRTRTRFGLIWANLGERPFLGTSKHRTPDLGRTPIEVGPTSPEPGARTVPGMYSYRPRAAAGVSASKAPSKYYCRTVPHQ